jgi:sugar phosphate permease
VAANKTMKPRLRWWIIWTCSIQPFVNYIDRRTLFMLAPMIIKKLRMTMEDNCYVTAAFQIVYASTWLVDALIIDVIARGLD